MICHMKYIFVWIFLIPKPTDGGSVTWYEPTPNKTTSNKNEVLPRGIVQVYEGSSVTLNWSYSLTAGLAVGVIKFNNNRVVRIKADGSADPVNAGFQELFSVSSTPGRASLFISNVTVAYDKANGEFSCELVDSNAEAWIRAIQVQVIVLTNNLEISGETTVREGRNLKLTCNVLGQPEPNITWTKEKPRNQGNAVVVHVGKVLTITNINRTAAGNYTCTAYNGFGKPENQTVYVNVTYPGKGVNFTPEYLVGLGKSVTLYCEAEGNPPPTYTWTPCNKFVTEQVCDKKTLDISQVCEDANYTCKVANGLGSDLKTANVFIAGEWINITIHIADGKYNKSSLSKEFDEVYT